MNLLFVCSQNRLRSPTAEAVFAAYDGLNAISAGTNHDAETPVSGDLIEWADIVFVMERVHHKKVTQRFPQLLRGKQMICLGVPDNYDYMAPELVTLLKHKVDQFVELPPMPE